MDRELEEKKAAAEHIMSSVLREDDAAVVHDYIAALEQYETKYRILQKSIEELTRQLLSGHLLGPRLVERRGHGGEES